jgi:hypothetical protein
MKSPGPDFGGCVFAFTSFDGGFFSELEVLWERASGFDGVVGAVYKRFK